MTSRPIELNREQVLAFRRRVQALDERLPTGPDSLRRAAWAGLQDSMPRAAVLSIHARVAGTEPETWADPSLAQVWGPRYSLYVTAAEDAALFTLGRYPDDARGRRVAEETAVRVHAFLQGGRCAIGTWAGRSGSATGPLRHDDRHDPDPLGRCPWHQRYGRFRDQRSNRSMRVSSSRADTSTCSAQPTAEAFAQWAGIGAAQGERPSMRSPASCWRSGRRWGALDPRLGRGRRSINRGRDRAGEIPPERRHVFPVLGADRELLVPDPRQRAELWTSRVWPGALLVGGDIVGVWRRAGAEVTVDPWRYLTKAERVAVEAEAATMPLPGLKREIRVRWPD